MNKECDIDKSELVFPEAVRELDAKAYLSRIGYCGGSERIRARACAGLRNNTEVTKGETMKELLIALKSRIEEGKDSVLCTVIASSGSTPRGAGARMLIGENGRICGTIGGGAVEYRAEQTAAEMLAQKRSGEKEFVLNRSDVEQLGMICGGDVRVYFQFIAGNDADAAAAVGSCINGINNGEDVWLVTDITAPESPKTGVITAAGVSGLPIEGADALKGRGAVLAEYNGARYYSEPVSTAGRLIVFGGGHVAQELVCAAARVGFNCIVLDDRPEFTAKELFAAARQTILCDFADISKVISIDKSDYVVVVTRGHAHDYTVLEQVLRTKAGYVGCIGSKRKTAAVAQRLINAGIDRGRVEEVHAPIGISIAAETPAEIAVSITAELIFSRVKRGV